MNVLVGIAIAIIVSYFLTNLLTPARKRRLTAANSVLVDVEGAWETLPDKEFQHAVKHYLIFVGPDGKLHLDRTKEREYYNSIMEGLK